MPASIAPSRQVGQQPQMSLPFRCSHSTAQQGQEHNEGNATHDRSQGVQPAQRTSLLELTAESLSKEGSSNCLFVGAITISVSGIDAPMRMPPAAQSTCDPNNHAAMPPRNPIAANGACINVALL